MPVNCAVCDKVFSTQFNLNKHTKKVHNIIPNIVSYDQSVWSYKCLEKQCNNSYHQNNGLINHLCKEHGFLFEEESLEFQDFASFQAWKTLVEEQHKCNYVTSSTFKNGKGRKIYYKCNRSGKSRPKSQNKRLAKTQGSCKLGRACTSEVCLLQSSLEQKKIVAIWKKTHYGHPVELQHNRILKKDRAVIATKLINGVSSSRIIDVYRDHMGHELNRVDLITRKDLSNIKNSYNINITDGVKHKSDAMSVDLWVRECELDSQNPVLFYKSQGVVDSLYNLSYSDFCLIIMTTFQKTMLEKFGDNIIAIDGTHGMNNYDFELTSVLVVDEFGEGIPVAFMFSNRKDTFIYEIFFSNIRSRVGVISPKTFMTDIVSTFSSAWNCTMQPASYQLFCSWHIDRAWQTNLTKITDKEKKSNVYKTLKVLQQNTDQNIFEKSLGCFIQQLLTDKDTYNFGIYFQNNYSLNYRQWAYSFRKECGINTNMRVESMHKVIKYFYLNGKKVKRLDKSLHILLKYVRDKSADRLIKTIKGKYTIHTKHIIKRHNTALSSNFIIYTDENANKWTVNSTSEVDGKIISYNVKKISDQSCCDLICVPCHICFHMYTCTCADFSMKTTICKHIHFIALANTKESTKNDTELCNNDENEYATKCKLNIKDKLASKICETTLKLNTTDLNTLDTDVLQQIHSHLNVIDHLTDLPKNKFEPPSVDADRIFTPIIGSNNEPANKNISKQLNFHSTQKKQKLSKELRKKPSKNERTRISSYLKSGVDQLYLSNCASNDHNYI